MRKTARYQITASKVLTKAEQENLVRVLTRVLHLDFEGRNGLMFLLILECGLRASELLNLRVKDFDYDNHQIFVESLKGSNKRDLPIKPSRSRQIRRHILFTSKADDLHAVDPNTLIFNIGYDRLGQLWDFYRPNKEKTIHSLRHTFAVNLYEKTRDIKVVQIALGHRNIGNTMVYLDFVYSRDTLRKIMLG